MIMLIILVVLFVLNALYKIINFIYFNFSYENLIINLVGKNDNYYDIIDKIL